MYGLPSYRTPCRSRFVPAHEAVVARQEPDRPLDILAYALRGLQSGNIPHDLFFSGSGQAVKNFFGFLILLKRFCKCRMRPDRPVLRVMSDRDFNDLAYPIW